MYDKLMCVAADSLPQHLFRTAGRWAVWGVGAVVTGG